MLPILDIIGSLKSALAVDKAVVLVAPPGAGKSTVVPLELINEPWVAGRKLILLEPRRLAARAAAARMATSLGEPVGRTVGFRVRMQSSVSAQTRIEVVTEGVFTRMILDDPGLEGVAGLIFDEFHERSLDADLGLALARDAQQVLRGDLRLLVMSATLDSVGIAALLGDAPILESQGTGYPVQTRYYGRTPTGRLEDDVARAVRRALDDELGAILVFLPGAGEIRRVHSLLEDEIRGRENVTIAPLYAALSPEAQDLAISPAGPGLRKVVLATSIAQTSLTLPDVRVVIDSGLSRAPRFDPSSGLTRLETVRVSRASADQRRGRAGRTQAGVCYRLWDEAQTRSLAPFDRPQILESDLAGVALDLAQWGAKDLAGLAFMDPPPATAFNAARALLRRLGALDERGDLTPHGRRLGRLPLPPRLAHMVSAGANRGQGERAALLAAVLSERGLGGASLSCSERVDRLLSDDSPRGREGRTLAQRWSKLVGGARGSPADPAADGLLVAEAYPERIAQARGGLGQFRLASGRGGQLDPSHSLARSSWLAVAELASGGPQDRITLAAPLDIEDVMSSLGDRIQTEVVVETDGQGRIRVRSLRRLDALILRDTPVEQPEPALVQTALLQQVRNRGLAALSWTEAAGRLRARVGFLRRLNPEDWPDLDDQALLDSLETWLGSLLVGCKAVSEVTEAALERAISDLIPWPLQRRLDAEAPERFVAPTGSALLIDYAAEGGPRVDIRVQELFGLGLHPVVANGQAPLTFALLSPARRPVQVTSDLPGFWAGSWKAVRSEMKARYPRHAWPENPLEATPTTRAKARGA